MCGQRGVAGGCNKPSFHGRFYAPLSSQWGGRGAGANSSTASDVSIGDGWDVLHAAAPRRTSVGAFCRGVRSRALRLGDVRARHHLAICADEGGHGWEEGGGALVRCIKPTSTPCPPHHHVEMRTKYE